MDADLCFPFYAPIACAVLLSICYIISSPTSFLRLDHPWSHQHHRRQQNEPPPPPQPTRSMPRLTLRLDAPLELSSMLRSGLTLLMCLCSCLIRFTLRVCFTLHGRATSFVVLHLILPTYTFMCPTHGLALEPHLRPLIYISPRTCSRIYPHPHDCLDTSPLCSRGLEDAVLVAVYFSSAMNE